MQFFEVVKQTCNWRRWFIFSEVVPSVMLNQLVVMQLPCCPKELYRDKNLQTLVSQIHSINFYMKLFLCCMTEWIYNLLCRSRNRRWRRWRRRCTFFQWNWRWVFFTRRTWKRPWRENSAPRDPKNKRVDTKTTLDTKSFPIFSAWLWRTWRGKITIVSLIFLRRKINHFYFQADARPGEQPRVIPDINVYQHKKTLAQGMMDLALLSANANQLRYVLESYERHPYYYFSVSFIVASLVFQVLVGIGLVFNSRYNVKNEDDICKADRINNLITVAILLITIINVFISAFGVAEVKTWSKYFEVTRFFATFLNE